MAQEKGKLSTQAVIWAAGAAGIILLVMLMLAGRGFFGALALGIVLAVIVYLVMRYALGHGGPGEASVPLAQATMPTDSQSAPKAPPRDSSGATAGLSAHAEEETSSAPAAPSAETPPEPEETPEQTTDTGAAASGATAGAAAPAEMPPASPALAAEPAPAQAAEGEGSKPEMLSAPKPGGPDNLKEIKGVGPKLEGVLNEMGVYHFDQIAGWGPAEVQWMDGNLKGFKGRVSRDDWVEQARILAAGGETEFSTRVDKGGVYKE